MNIYAFFNLQMKLQTKCISTIQPHLKSNANDMTINCKKTYKSSTIIVDKTKKTWYFVVAPRGYKKTNPVRG